MGRYIECSSVLRRARLFLRVRARFSLCRVGGKMERFTYVLPCCRGSALCAIFEEAVDMVIGEAAMFERFILWGV